MTRRLKNHQLKTPQLDLFEEGAEPFVDMSFSASNT